MARRRLGSRFRRGSNESRILSGSCALARAHKRTLARVCAHRTKACMRAHRTQGRGSTHASTHTRIRSLSLFLTPRHPNVLPTYAQRICMHARAYVHMRWNPAVPLPTCARAGAAHRPRTRAHAGEAGHPPPGSCSAGKRPGSCSVGKRPGACSAGKRPGPCSAGKRPGSCSAGEAGILLRKRPGSCSAGEAGHPRKRPGSCTAILPRGSCARLASPAGARPRPRARPGSCSATRGARPTAVGARVRVSLPVA